MAGLSVSEAAARLGVNVPRIHKRIADGSLRAERVGSQWVIDERSLLDVSERRAPGRPLSVRSAWAVIAASADDEDSLSRFAPSERLRARRRLSGLMAEADDLPAGEGEVRAIAASLRSLLRNRAVRRLFRVAPADLDDLRGDNRWAALVGSAASGIASNDVEGYLAERDLEHVVRDLLLVPVLDDANVIVHVLPDGQRPYPESKLRLAADLAEHRGPRDELRAAELLHELAMERKQ